MKKIKIGLVQMSVEESKDKNLENASKYVNHLAKMNADIIVLPEMFTTPYQTKNFPIYAEKEGGKSFKYLSKIAKENNVYLVGGSIPEIDDENHVYNTSYVFDRNGEKIAKHRKIHLFDIDIDNGQYFKESDTLSPGNEITVFDSEFGKMGLCICFDFRFPELARLMVDKGAKIVFVPAAFNMTTGPIHWDLMFKSRAVDNQIYTVGCAPSRDTNSDYISYANSLICSPWGDILYKMGTSDECKVFEIDLDYVDKIRAELPLLSARRFDLYNLVDKTNL